MLDFNRVRLFEGPCLPNFPGLTSEGDTAYNLINSLAQTRRGILTTEYISLIERCDRAGDKWQAGTLHTG